MDLEVREPIDFSSGDHQHLVRKAADSNIHTKAGQPYATSPSEAPKTHGNPRPKTREQMDIYVVQISDDTTPDDSNNLANPFSDSWIRRGENEINLLQEKSKSSLKMFPQSGWLEDLTLSFIFPVMLYHETWCRAAPIDGPHIVQGVQEFIMCGSLSKYEFLTACKMFLPTDKVMPWYWHSFKAY